MIKLKYADQNAEGTWSAVHAGNPWLDEIEQATNGRVEFERYFGQTLVTGMDTWEGLKAGVADLAWCMFQYWPNLVPLAEVITLPFLPYESAELNSSVIWQLYEEFPSISEQFSANRPAAVFTSTPFYLLTTKEVRTLEDMKGLKIRTLGGPPTALVEAIGASGVLMPQPDIYQNMQTGVLDGALANWEGIYSFRLYEVGKYLLEVPFHCGMFGQAWNHNSWNGLPADVQGQIDSVSGSYASRFWGKNMFDSAEAEVPDLIAKQGYELVRTRPTDEQIAEWAEKYGAPLWEDWVAKMESQGHSDARAILDRAIELLEQGLPQ
ncbi:MAG: TRAP transporter substrate-binding protein [Actinomycetia bacterium]|nr:TRAP transporter substrate-binding protein [Actinomycetes bacterium]